MVANPVFDKAQAAAPDLKLVIIEQDNDKIVFDGEWGTCIVYANGEVASDVKGYVKALKAAIAEPAESPKMPTKEPEAKIIPKVPEKPRFEPVVKPQANKDEFEIVDAAREMAFIRMLLSSPAGAGFRAPQGNYQVSHRRRGRHQEGPLRSRRGAG